MSLSLCTVAFAVDENYETFILPVISDKLPADAQTSEIEMYLDKETNTVFAALNDVCKLIGAKCSQEKDIYAVQRDAVYFTYNGKDNMELFLLTENSTSALVDAASAASGNIIRKNIFGHRLLDGNLFESRRINNKWYVDYIKFCDMFAVKLSKYTSKNYDNTCKIIKELNIALEYDTSLDFNNYPYYIKMYSGTTLSSIYQKIMKDQDTYIFNFYSLNEKNDDFWDDVDQKLTTKFQLFDLEYKNILSNVINDWNGFASVFLEQYDPGEHYTESLLNVLNSNYIKNIIENGNTDNNSSNFSDLLETITEKYGKVLDRESEVLSYYDVFDNYTEFVKELAKNNNGYRKALNSMAGKPDNMGVNFSILKVLVNSVSSFKEANDTCKAIEDLGSDKKNMLRYGILENERLSEEASKVNVSGIIDKIIKIYPILYPTGIVDSMVANYLSKAMQNSEDSAKGLIESAKKIDNLYGNYAKQSDEVSEKFKKAAAYTAIDESVQTVLERSPSTVPVAVAMSVIDGSMALAKSAIGEETKDAENLVQYFYIEQNLLCNLDEWNPEKLHSNLTFALMASLCCYETKRKTIERDLKEMTEKVEEEYSETYFQLIDNIEGQMNGCNDSIRKISAALYKLDHQKTQLRIDYYHDPRNNSVDNDIEKDILNYVKEKEKSDSKNIELTKNSTIEPNVHYFGTETVSGMNFTYDLYMPSESIISVTVPTERGGSVNYYFSDVTYSDGTYSYTGGVQSEYVPGAMRSLVSANNLTGYVKIIDSNTVEWNNNGGRDLKLILKKG